MPIKKKLSKKHKNPSYRSVAYKVLVMASLLFLWPSLYAKDQHKENYRMTKEQIASYPAANIRHENLQDGQKLVVAGKIRQVGHGKFVSIVLTPLTNFDIHLRLTIDQHKLIIDLMHQYVEVEGTLSVKKMLLPNGDFVRYKYSLSPQSIRPLLH